jgi:hypothetical protein
MHTNASLQFFLPKNKVPLSFSAQTELRPTKKISPYPGMSNLSEYVQNLLVGRSSA